MLTFRHLKKAKCIVSRCGATSEQGLRESNEDRHACFPYMNELFSRSIDGGLSFFGVFDGHGGVECANYVSTHLHVNIARHPYLISNTRLAIYDAFMLTQHQWTVTMHRAGLSAITGSTCITAIIQERKLYIAWAGDSSAILFLKNGIWLEFVSPHKPSNENEKQRIISKGGFVQDNRVNGILAVSRSFGDIKYGCVNPEPDIMDYTMTGSEAYLILACDGLTDVMQPIDMQLCVTRAVASGITDSKILAQSLVQEALTRGSTDNISVIYVPFDNQSRLEKALNEGYMTMKHFYSTATSASLNRSFSSARHNEHVDTIPRHVHDPSDDDPVFAKESKTPPPEMLEEAPDSSLQSPDTTESTTQSTSQSQSQSNTQSYTVAAPPRTTSTQRGRVPSATDEIIKRKTTWNNPNVHAVSELSALEELSRMLGGGGNTNTNNFTHNTLTEHFLLPALIVERRESELTSEELEKKYLDAIPDIEPAINSVNSAGDDAMTTLMRRMDSMSLPSENSAEVFVTTMPPVRDESLLNAEDDTAALKRRADPSTLENININKNLDDTILRMIEGSVVGQFEAELPDPLMSAGSLPILSDLSLDDNDHLTARSSLFALNNDSAVTVVAHDRQFLSQASSQSEDDIATRLAKEQEEEDDFLSADGGLFDAYGDE